MEDLMNKINVLFLTTLILAGPNAYGMNQAIKDLRKGVKDAKAGVKEAGDNNLPNKMVENASDEIKGLNKDVKGLKKETDSIVDGVFELSETLASFGGYKQRYNSHINTLNKLRSEAKQGDELEFDEADFQDLIDQEAAALQKQQKSVPVAVSRNRNNRRNNVRQQQPAQRVAAVMPNHVEQLKRSVEAFNYAIDNHVNIQPQPQPRQGRRGRAPVINNRSSVADARKALNKTIDDFKDALESKREAVCEKSTLGEFVYGGSSIRSLATMAVVALGALYLGQSVKDSETGQKASGWFTQGTESIKGMFSGAFDWIKKQFTATA